jgi:hypothetical protein
LDGPRHRPYIPPALGAACLFERFGMMWRLKSWVKSVLVGPPGDRLHTLRRGLLKGLNFHLDSAIESIYLLGMYEREIAADTRRLAGQAATALDIGANSGWYTTYFSSLPNLQQVWSFEPSAPGAAECQRNLDVNKPEFAAKVRLVPKMVGSKDDEQWCSIDALADQMPGNILLKIDVDGGEVDVLKGAEKTLKNRPCSLVVETHGADLERDCLAMLAQLGYRTRVIDMAWYRLFLRENRPIEFNRWFVAERA